MEIQTKYNVGDNVLLKRLKGNKVTGIVLGITIKVIENYIIIEYLMKIPGFIPLTFAEEELNEVV